MFSKCESHSTNTKRSTPFAWSAKSADERARPLADRPPPSVISLAFLEPVAHPGGAQTSKCKTDGRDDLFRARYRLRMVRDGLLGEKGPQLSRIGLRPGGRSRNFRMTSPAARA